MYNGDLTITSTGIEAWVFEPQPTVSGFLYAPNAIDPMLIAKLESDPFGPTAAARAGRARRPPPDASYGLAGCPRRATAFRSFAVAPHLLGGAHNPSYRGSVQIGRSRNFDPRRAERSSTRPPVRRMDPATTMALVEWSLVRKMRDPTSHVTYSPSLERYPPVFVIKARVIHGVVVGQFRADPLASDFAQAAHISDRSTLVSRSGERNRTNDCQFQLAFRLSRVLRSRQYSRMKKANTSLVDEV
jgi:hypothetical protein